VSVPFVSEFIASSWTTGWVISRSNSILSQESMLWNSLRISHLRKRKSLWVIILSFTHVVMSWAKPHVFLSLAQVWVAHVVIVVSLNLSISSLSLSLEHWLSICWCLFSCWSSFSLRLCF
jgi:hypothetical protein